MGTKLTPEVLSDWERKHRGRLRAIAILSPLAGLLVGLILIGWINYLFEPPTKTDYVVQATHGQSGLLYSTATDPTTGLGVSAPIWQLLVRTDIPAIYVKSGTADTAWTMLGFGNATTPGGPWGDGNDGTVVVSSPITLARDMYYKNLTLNSTLNTGGFMIYIQNFLTGTGTITNAGNTGGNGTAVAGGISGVGGATGTLPGGQAGGQGGFFSQGNPGASTGTRFFPYATNGVAGGTGGGSPTGGAGGTNAIAAATNGSVEVTPFAVIGRWSQAYTTQILIGAGGGGGRSNATTCGGGGGGGGGGWVSVAAHYWTGSVTIDAHGGTGGNGFDDGSTGCGGGGGGQGGVIAFQTSETTIPTTNVSGGLGGTSVHSAAAGTGSNGYVISLPGN
jgi:hypothetical protein